MVITIEISKSSIVKVQVSFQMSRLKRDLWWPSRVWMSIQMTIFIHIFREDETRNGHRNAKQKSKSESDTCRSRSLLKFSNEKRPRTTVIWFRFGFLFTFPWPFRVSSLRGRAVAVYTLLLGPDSIRKKRKKRKLKNWIGWKMTYYVEEEEYEKLAVVKAHAVAHLSVCVCVCVCQYICTCVCVCVCANTDICMYTYCMRYVFTNVYAARGA